MDASIDFSGVLRGSIADGGGGGGGDSVVITPVVTSGTKIADVSVNGVEKDLYCPTVTPTQVIVTPTQQSGTKIGSISVNGNEIDLYAPNPTQVTVDQVQQSGTKIATIGVNGQNTDIYAPNGGVHEYSTTEHIVGVWVDGRPLYEKTIIANAPTGAGTFDLVTLDSDIDLIVSQSALMYSGSHIRFLPYTDIGNYDTNIYYNLPTLKLVVDNDNWSGYQVCITIQYTKSTDLS